MSAALVLLALVLAGLAVATLASWRLGLGLFVAWMLVEDLPRKYLGNNMAVFFGKDLLLALVYAGFLLALRHGRVRPWRPPFLLPLAALVALGIAQVFNPASPSPWYGVMGVKLDFYYAGLAVVGHAALRDARDLRRALVAFAAAAGVIGALGLAQGIVGLDFLNPEALAPELLALGREVRYSPLTQAVVPRATSVFVSEARYGAFMVLAYIVTAGAALDAARRAHPVRWALMALAGLALTAVAMHGSRGGILYATLSTLVLGVAVPATAGAEGRRRLRAPALVGLASVLALTLALLLAFPRDVAARWALYAESLSPWSPRSELAYRLWAYPVANIRDAVATGTGLLGQGLGTASIGAYYVAASLGVPAPTYAGESGIGTLLLELGILGPLLWVAWAGVLVREGARVAWRLRGGPAGALAMAIAWFAFLLLFPITYGALNPYQNYTTNALFWLLVGVLFRLPSLPDGEARDDR